MERIDFDTWTAREVARLLTVVENDRRYYQDILTMLPVAVAVVSRELSLVLVNRSFRVLFRLKHADLADKRLDDLISSAVVKERIPNLLDLNTPESGIAINVPDADGVNKSFRLSVIPLWDPYQDGPNEALITVVETEHPTSASARILEEFGAVVWKLDVNTGNLEFSNRGITALLGGGAPTDWASRVHPADASRVAWVYEAVLESAAEATVEYRAVRADGLEAWFADRIRPVVEQGKVTALQIVTSEEGARRERIRRLVQTREMEAAMRLAQHVAHEFNNLWMIVNGYTEVVAEKLGDGDAESRSSLDAIQKAAERGIATTSQLLLFGRPPSAQMQSIDLNAWLRNAGIEAELRLMEGSASVSADPAKLDTALHAILDFIQSRFTGSQQVSIETGLAAVISDYADGLPRGQFVALRIGPVERLNPQLFTHWCDPYFSEMGKAAPFGLALTCSQLRQMGIRMRMDAAEAERGAFVLEFPLVRLPQPRKADPRYVPPVEAETPAARLETVLVVDDEESIRSLVVRVLSRQGYVVIDAPTPDEAIRISEGHAGPIALVVSDVILPGMRGPELVKRLRQKRQDLRVLYISGYTDDPELAAGVLGTGEGFLQKPFALQALTQTVRAVLDAPKD